MHDDIRFSILWAVNELRQFNGLPPLRFHEEESRKCKAIAEALADRGVARDAGPEKKPGISGEDWIETVHHTKGELEPKQAVESMIYQMDKPRLQALLKAKQFLAADIAHRRLEGGHRVLLCMRFR